MNEDSSESEISEDKNLDNFEDIIIPYLKDDDIPNILIKNQNLMIYDGVECNINEYIKEIEDYTNENKYNENFLNEYKYEICGFCKDNINKYFCESCQKNICGECSLCKDENHILQSLYEMKVSYKNYIKEINSILNHYIIPIEEKKDNILNDKEYIKKNKENSGKKENIISEKDGNIQKEEDKHNDILLIKILISIYFNNYFHFKNVERIYNYCKEIYAKYSNIKYEGKGKLFLNRVYYIGEFKYGLRNGKGIIYNKNRDIIYDGDFVNDNAEGNGKIILEKGEYYIGEFKNGLINGKGIIYNKNGDIIYDGDWLNNEMEGNGKYIYEDNKYYIGEFKNGLRNGKGIKYNKKGDIIYDGDWVNNKAEKVAIIILVNLKII